jgi:hypothetical protein
MPADPQSSEAYREPPTFRKPQKQLTPELEPFQAVIDQILDDDLKNPPKPRHYSTHIHRRLIPGVWLPVPLARMSSARASWMNKSRGELGIRCTRREIRGKLGRSLVIICGGGILQAA